MRVRSGPDHRVSWLTIGKLGTKKVGLAGLDILELERLAGLRSSNSRQDGGMG